MKRIVFVTGGARSGKSSFALRHSEAMPGSKVFIATAEPLDAEMRERIARHRRERSSDWLTIEEPKDIAPRLEGLREGVVLIDCLTLWISNLLGSGLDDGAVAREAQRLTLSCMKTGASVVAVSNEVGLGITPGDALSRRFVDLCGLANQGFAQISDEVYLVTAGIPLKVK